MMKSSNSSSDFVIPKDEDKMFEMMLEGQMTFLSVILSHTVWVGL